MAHTVRSTRSVVLAAWLGCCVLATIGAAAVYGFAQQVGRRAADDVPRALVAQVVAALSSREQTIGLPVSGPATTLSSQSAPFVIVYDSAHRVMSTTALLDDGTPGLPAITLDDAVSRGGTNVTWQPRAGVREAVIAQPWTGPSGSGVVVAGVGLGSTEDRARSVLVAVTAGWALVLLTLTAALFILRRGTKTDPPAQVTGRIGKR
ncbi:MAG TPA: hypothetical protein VI110_11290 [Lapillicoccus sp.]